MMFGRRILSRNSKEDPADYVFRKGYYPTMTCLFDDGTFGIIQDVEFDVADFIDDPDFDFDILDSIDSEKTDRVIRKQFGGKLPIGNLYIDRWDLDGEFYQGGCFLYYEGETLRDYCYRNGEPYPVRDIPYEVIDAFEAHDLEALRRLSKAVPELKEVCF